MIDPTSQKRIEKERITGWRNCKHCGKVFYKKHAKHYFCSRECGWKGQKYNSGPNHPNWRGGRRTLKLQIRSHPKYRSWLNNVLQRDNFTCTGCGKKPRHVEVDHIKRFADILYDSNVNSLEDALNCAELWDEGNGRTLCVPCHNATKITFDGNASIVQVKTRDEFGEPLKRFYYRHGNTEPSGSGDASEGVTTRLRPYQRITTKCTLCNAPMERAPSIIKGRKNIFCSQRCKGKYYAKFRYRLPNGTLK